jgi:hypothetical protein
MRLESCVFLAMFLQFNLKKKLFDRSMVERYFFPAIFVKTSVGFDIGNLMSLMRKFKRLKFTVMRTSPDGLITGTIGAEYSDILPRITPASSKRAISSSTG